jgi:hypothetical protein
MATPAARGTVARSLTVAATGDRASMRAALATGPGAHLAELDRTDPRHPRVWIRRRGATYPTAEELWTVVPAFPGLWDRLTSPGLFEMTS